jgi:hypothetical protein
MAFENPHDLDTVVEIAKEDYILPEGQAAHIRAKLGPLPAEQSRKPSELFAAQPHGFHKSFANRAAATRIPDEAAIAMRSRRAALP